MHGCLLMTLGVSSSNFHDLRIQLNFEANKVQDWLLANKLSVHYKDKTKFILFIPRRKQKPNDFFLEMGGHRIEQTKVYKYLGILIDEKLNWEPQISKMCSKLSSVVGVLSKVRHFLNRNTLRLIYNTLVESRLRYGILSWCTASRLQLNRLKVLQNRAIRFINFSPIGTYLPPLYFHFKVLPLESLILLQKATYMYCLFNNQLPLVFRTYCVRPAHPHGTRYAETNYFRPHHASKLSEKSIKIMGPKVWADVPLEIKSMPFRKSFTKNMKQHHIDKLPSVQRARVINFNRNHRDEFRDLQILFESDDENDSDFLGFDLDFERLEILFNSDTDDENDSDFPGFDLDFERL